LGPVAHRADYDNPLGRRGVHSPRAAHNLDWLENQSIALRHVFVILISLIGTVGLLLGVLHGVEAVFWAAAYWWVGALASPEQAILYSVDSISTRGASGLALPQHWRILGALEAVDGMLLFGISTAFIFAVMQGYWPLFTSHFQHSTEPSKSISSVPR